MTTETFNSLGRRVGRKKSSIFFKASILLVLLGLFFARQAQPQQARARMKPDTIFIGQPSTLKINVEALKGDLVVLPVMTDSIYQDIEFRGLSVDTLSTKDQNISFNFRFPFTSWTPKTYNFLPLTVKILRHDDTLFVESNPFSLVVLAPELADDAEIYDIKPIKKMKASLREILTYFIPIVLVLGLIAWLVYRHFFRKKKQTVDNIWENDAIPAHIAAISSLEKLRNQKLWQAGKIKQYHSELTFIVRMYIEKRFSVPALEMTTREICKSLPPHLDKKESLDDLKPALEVADLVKFAKYQPLPVENEKSLEQAIEFVKANIEPEVEPEEGQKGKQKEKPGG